MNNLDPSQQLIQINQQEKVMWFRTLQYNAQSGSRESLDEIARLCHKKPNFEIPTPEITQLIDSLKNFSSTKKYDPELANKVQAAFTSFKKNYSQS